MSESKNTMPAPKWLLYVVAAIMAFMVATVLVKTAGIKNGGSKEYLGTWYASYEDVTCQLDVNKDNTFTLLIIGPDSSNVTSGTWTASDDTLTIVSSDKAKKGVLSLSEDKSTLTGFACSAEQTHALRDETVHHKERRSQGHGGQVFCADDFNGAHIVHLVISQIHR